MYIYIYCIILLLYVYYVLAKYVLDIDSNMKKCVTTIHTPSRLHVVFHIIATQIAHTSKDIEKPINGDGSCMWNKLLGETHLNLGTDAKNAGREWQHDRRLIEKECATLPLNAREHNV